MFPHIEELFKKIRFNFVVIQDFENISLFSETFRRQSNQNQRKQKFYGKFS